MLAAVVYIGNPLQPLKDRRVIALRRRRRLDKLAPTSRLPFICLRNGAPILRRDWKRTTITDGDCVAFVTLLQDGGGGGGSDPVRIVAMLAVMAFAPYAATAMGFAATGMAAAGIALAGTMLVNALLPPPKPPSSQRLADLAAGSPTYSLQAQGNGARLGEPIPVQYGRHLAYPDYAAEPYAEFEANEQYLYQLFVIGQGEHDIEAVRIEDTAVASFAEIAYEIVPPGGTVTLFPTDVVNSIEVSGQELTTGNYVGPFVANPAGTVANILAVDVVCPKGLYYANDSGGLDPRQVDFTIEARKIDDAGAPIGSFVVVDRVAIGQSMPVTSGNVSAIGGFIVKLAGTPISGGTTTPQRKTYKYSMGESARWEVRLKRNDAKDTSSRAGHDLAWFGLRAYLPGSQQYGAATLLAMRMRATNNLSQQASRKVNVIATRKLPTWNPTTGWSAPAATRSIAWALADAARAEYGAQLADSRIDLAQLYALDQTWTARGDYFDFRFDQRQTVWEALELIARAGRAKRFMQGGILHVVRDQAASLPVALFSMRNIVRGSFEVEYLMPSDETPDAVEVEFFDATTWTWDRVSAALAGSVAAKPAKVRLAGVTGRDQAWREGMYMAAANVYRRKLPKFATELEGFIPSYGDLVAVAHDMPRWGQSGELTGWNAGALTATTSEPLSWGAGTHYIGLRRAGGSMAGPYACTRGADDSTVVLAAAPDFTPYTGARRERTHYAFGATQATSRLLARVRDIKPRGDNRVELLLVNEADEVHAADGGSVPAPPASWQLPLAPTIPAVTDLRVTQGGTPDKPVMSLSWTPAAGAERYLIEQSADGQLWTRVGDTTASAFSFTAQPGPLYLRVAGQGLAIGAWAATGLIDAGSGVAPPGDVAAVTASEAFTGPVLRTQWADAARATSYRVRVYDTATLTQRRERVVTVPRFEYTAADAAADGGPWRDLTVRVWAIGASGLLSTNYAQLQVTNAQAAAPTSATVAATLSGLDVQITGPAATDLAGYRIHASTSTGFTPGAGNLVYDGPDSKVRLDLDPNVAYYLKVAAVDVWGADGLTYSAQFSSTTGLVQTGHVQQDAITVPSMAYTAASLNFDPTISDQIEIQSLAVSADGSSPLLIEASCRFVETLNAWSEHYGWLKLFRRQSAPPYVVTIYDVLTYVPTFAGGAQYSSQNALVALFVDSPPAGNYTYTVETQIGVNNGGTLVAKPGTFSHRLLRVTEVKR